MEKIIFKSSDVDFHGFVDRSDPLVSMYFDEGEDERVRGGVYVEIRCFQKWSAKGVIKNKKGT